MGDRLPNGWEGLEPQSERAGKPRPGRRARVASFTLALVVAAAGLGILLFRPRSPPRAAGGATPRSETRSWLERLLGRGGRTDALGDALPPGALLRLGTVRLRHGGPVTALAFTPDDASIVSASEDGTASIWNAASGEERHRFALGVNGTSLAVARDGSRLVVGGDRHWTAWLVDLNRGLKMARLLPARPRPRASTAVTAVAWAPDGTLFATRGEDGVDLWSPRDARHVRAVAACGGGRGLAFLEGSRFLLVDCRDGSARVLESSSGAETRRLRTGNEGEPIQVSLDGRRLAVASRSSVRLLDVATGSEGGVLGGAEAGAGGISSVAFSPGGGTLAAGLGDGRVVLFDVSTRATARVLDAQPGPVHALAFAHDEATLAVAGGGHTIRLFDVASGEERGSSAGHVGPVRGLDFSSSVLVTTGDDATVRRWDEGGGPAGVRTLDRPGFAAFTLSPSRVAVVEPLRVHVYDTASGWEVTSASLPAMSSRAGVAVAPAPALLAAGAGSALDLVELGTGKRRSLRVPRHEEVLALSPDGRVLATLRAETEPLAGRALVVRDTETGRELVTVPHNRGGPFPSRCRSADDSFFGFNGALWRLRSDPRSRLERHGWPGRATGPCAVSPDGSVVAFPRDDPQTIELRVRAAGASGQPELRYLATLAGHRGPVMSLAFGRDSRTLASGGADTSVLVWDVAASRTPSPAPPPRRRARGPLLALSFEQGIEGTGVVPVRTPADSPLRLVPGWKGRALRPAIPLAFPEGRDLVVGDEFAVSVAFAIGVEGLRADAPNQSLLSSELVTLDVRDGRALLFLHLVRQGGHTSVDLSPWIGRVQPERWYRVGVSYSRTEGGRVRVCVDGVCGPGRADPAYSDRVGPLVLAPSALSSPFAGAIDELAIQDRALSDDELAAAAGLARAIPLPSPTPSPTPPALPPPPVEEEPLPREALPQGRDVTAHVTVEEQSGFTVYRFGGPLARAQTLDLDLGQGAVWVGTSLGLLRHDPRSASWRLWDEAAGLPGERLDEIAVAAGRVVVDSSTPSGPGSVRGTGVLSFDLATATWTPLPEVGGVQDLWGDGATLWVGTGTGAEERDLARGTVRRFTRERGELVHDAVHAVRRHGETVAFATLGDYVRATKDFAGGGVTLWDRRRNAFRRYTAKDGLARGYSCDLFLDDDEVFVAHWDEVLGLSRIDRRTGRVEALRRSADGVPLGGVVLAGEPGTLWVGQQGALVRLDRDSRKAEVLRERDGLPGYIVSAISVGEDAVWASLYSYGREGVRSAGLVRFPRVPR